MMGRDSVQKRVYGAAQQRGFTLIEVLLALFVFGALLATVSHTILHGEKQLQAATVAQQAVRFDTALKHYIQDNYTTVKAAAPVTLTTTTLIANGYLPSNFGSGSKHKNPLGQQYEVRVTNPSGNVLKVLMLTTGGTSVYTHISSSRFANLFIPEAAGDMGYNGGYVATGKRPSQSAGDAYSPSGTWSLAPSSMGISSPGAGHLAAFMYFNDGTYNNDYLYRKKVPGQPQLNKMQTNLGMQGNNINNAGEVETSKGKKLSTTIQYTSIVGNNGTTGATVAKPTCKSGENPKIFISPVEFSNNATGYPLASVQTYAISSGSNWVVHMRVLTKSGWTFPSSQYAKMAVFTKCG